MVLMEAESKMFEIANNSNISVDPDWGHRATDAVSIFKVDVFPSNLELGDIWQFFVLLPSLDLYDDVKDEQSLVYAICCSFLNEKDKLNIQRVESEEDIAGYDKGTPILACDPNMPMRYVWLKPPRFMSC